jgi:hypothetical protein
MVADFFGKACGDIGIGEEMLKTVCPLCAELCNNHG